MIGPFKAAARGETLGALIVAAGYSSRMGAFKPLLPLDGKAILEHAVELFRQGGIPDITVVVGHRSDELMPLLDRLAVRPVVNPSYDQGMYSSAVAGFAALPPTLTGCFFLPADIPLVRPHTIADLAAGTVHGAPVIYPTFGGQRGHPPLVARALFAEILASDGNGGVKAVLDRHDHEASEIAVFDQGIHLDIDRPADYQAVQTRRHWIDVPNRIECWAILADRSVPRGVFRHVRAVADVAEIIAGAAAIRGVPLDIDLVLAGALLHDVAKGMTNHAAIGAAIVERLGFPRVARLVADHSNPAVADGDLDERGIVYLADKLVCGDRVVSIAERFQRGMARFADDRAALCGAAQRMQAAERIASIIEARLGVPLADLLKPGGDEDRSSSRHRQDTGAKVCCATSSRLAPRLLDETESVCPVCLDRIAARHVGEGDTVYLRKTCPTHGDFSTVVWRGPPSYENWGQSLAPFSPPPGIATKAAGRGCPFDCGLCAGHRQRSCCVLLEVTARCNLSCPICFAAAGSAVADPGLAEIAGWLDMLRASAPSVNIQLSGGEPTLRDDLPEIVALCRDRGFTFVQVNTNGIRIAKDPAYLRRLKQAGLDCVFLQFDGMTDAIYRQIRGADLLADKLAAIRHCAEMRLGVVLVPVLVPGVNTAQIGEILRFAISQVPVVRTVHFQPVSYFGRYPETPDDSGRVTLPEVLRLIEEQTAGAIRIADFQAGTAENPYCSFNGQFTIGRDGTLATSRPGRQAGCCASSAAIAPALAADPAGEEVRRARQFVARRWAAEPDEPSSAMASACGSDAATASLDAFLAERRRTLCISGMVFQDAWTLDLARLRQCYIHVVSPDHRLVPLCAYNLSSRSGGTLYRGNRR
ncbi:MAG: NTP transferase domain-containing protein [Azospirillaceae bacterium]|nr:NTP transferase domain-containing protein [Azospirillaceae bacterium]